jgi:hypothetical protein
MNYLSKFILLIRFFKYLLLVILIFGNFHIPSFFSMLHNQNLLLFSLSAPVVGIMRSNENLGWVGVQKSKPFGTV